MDAMERAGPAWIRMWLGIATAVGCLGSSLWAQQGNPSYEIEVRLVQIEVRVRDKSGEGVKGLRREDFVLKDDGRTQKIQKVTYVSLPAVATTSTRAVEPFSKAVEDRTESFPTTWIYVVPEFGSPSQFIRSAPAIRDFISSQLRPGIKLSLAGLPFTDRKDLLLAILARMLKGPYGESGKTPAVVDPTLSHLEDLEFQRFLAEEIRRQNLELAPLSGFGRDPMFQGRATDVRFFTIERLDRQIPLYGQMALMRYSDLIRRLAQFPGKKCIVLFRPGLRLDKDNADLLSQISSTALRHHVSFYTIDPKGLDTVIANDESRRATFVWTVRSNRPDTDIMRDQALAVEARGGLMTLAESTGGKTVSNTNDMGQILDVVLKESSDYYLLEYYPDNLAAEGRFRKVEVSVNRPGAKVDAVRGYYEPTSVESVSRNERTRAVYGALDSEISRDFPVEATVKVFADTGKHPLLVYSAGLRPGNLTPVTRKKEVYVNVAAILKTNPVNTVQLSDYKEEHVEYKVSSARWAQFRDDPTAAVTLNSTMSISPGGYTWKIALQDQVSGKVGAVEKVFDIPDFRSPSTPSSLLLTREVSPLKRISGRPGVVPAGDSAAQDPLQVLDAGNLRYFPQHANLFRQGDVIYFLYHLYNPTPGDWEAASQGMQMALEREGMPVTGVEAGGQPYPDRGGEVIRFAGFLNTRSLQPGTYTLLAILPNYLTREIPHLEETFRVIAAPPHK